ncbi:MAG: glycosyltransferase, partial [Halobacteriaceae archaeon]
TDTYLPTVNGVTYTVETWRDRWHQRNGCMDIIYPKAKSYSPDENEYPVFSLRFPFYPGFRMGAPLIPESVSDADVVHSHTPFGVGYAGLRLAKRESLPFVVSYHTPIAEYTRYITPGSRESRLLRKFTQRFERWFFNRANRIIAPTEQAKNRLREDVNVTTPVKVIPNGVNIDHFKPQDPDEFLSSYSIPSDKPIIGYTGRHGFEKQLEEIIDATESLDVRVLFGGDGPARETLEQKAREVNTDIRFLGFLDREELPLFYSTLDVFAFPSPVETQGLVALEANACGTPVVGANSGALAATIKDDETGYNYESGNSEAFAKAIEKALDNVDRLSETCLARREELSVTTSIDDLTELYAEILDN